jgi:hypothetical protein
MTPLHLSPFDNVLKNRHSCSFDATNIGVSGTTTDDWKSGSKLEQLVEQAKTHDYIWLTLMGNDALHRMPKCASTGKSAEECGNTLINDVMMPQLGGILDAIHEANPAARVVGFGYDIVFGGLGCDLAARYVFPQCWQDETATETTAADEIPLFFALDKNATASSRKVEKGFAARSAAQATCFHTQFVKLQAGWEQLASNRSWVDTINILGLGQKTAGYAGVSVGHPDLSQFGPGRYYPLDLGCIHPSIVPHVPHAWDSGADMVMEEFYKQYWSSKLSC